MTCDHFPGLDGDPDCLTCGAEKREAEELKESWARYRNSVLMEAWEALRDADGGPLIDAMNVITRLTEKR